MTPPMHCTDERFCKTSHRITNRYHNDVLVGNWFEQRMKGQTDPSAITPKILGVSKCINDRTVYQDNFKSPVPKNTPSGTKGVQDYLDTRLTFFRNKRNGREVNYKYITDDSYLRNMTTMTDVKFRLEPLEWENLPPNPLKWPKLEDPLNRHGNLTETGLIGWRRCEDWREKQNREDMSVYQNTYKPKKPISNKPSPKCTMRIPPFNVDYY